MNNKILDKINSIDGVLLAYVGNVHKTEVIIVELKPPKPVLISHDGIAMFDGDECFPLHSGQLPIFDNNAPWIVGRNFLNGPWQVFSTAQARNKYLESLKPKSLQPSELIDGEIYICQDNWIKIIFRFKSIRSQIPPLIELNCYSNARIDNNSNKELHLNTWIGTNKREILYTTTKDKQYLIKLEIIDYDYYHELRNK
jgi:hypothetical protein